MSHIFKMPDPPQVAINPAPQQQQAEQQALIDKTSALQTKLQGDTSSIMSRYGALISMQGAASGAGASK